MDTHTHTHVYVSTPSLWRSFRPSVNWCYKTGVNQVRPHVVTCPWFGLLKWCLQETTSSPRTMNIVRAVLTAPVSVSNTAVPELYGLKVNKNAVQYFRIFLLGVLVFFCFCRGLGRGGSKFSRVLQTSFFPSSTSQLLLRDLRLDGLCSPSRRFWVS